MAAREVNMGFRRWRLCGRNTYVVPVPVVAGDLEIQIGQQLLLGTIVITAVLASAGAVAVLAGAQTPRGIGIGRITGLVAGCPPESARFQSCALEKAKRFNPPRTSDGQPDLQGYWEAPTTSGSQNIEEYPGGGPLEFGPAITLIVDSVDGKIPYQPWALAKRRELRDHFLDPYALCFSAGVPRQMYQFRPNQIIQLPKTVVIVNQTLHSMRRVIPTDGRPHLRSNIKLFQGDSRGHWEGNTLVIDVTNLTDKTWFDVAGDFHSDGMHVVERLTLIDPDVIHYEATIEDRNVFTRPWKLAFPLVRHNDPNYEAWEEQCNEGNHDLPRLLLERKPYPGVTVP